MEKKFWEGGRGRWNGHAAFNTVNHHHISCYSPAEGFDSCDLMIVECSDGRWYVEDNWGGDAKGAEKVWNPFDPKTDGPYFFDCEKEARIYAVSVVARICGIPETSPCFAEDN